MKIIYKAINFYDNLTVKRPGIGYFQAGKITNLFGKKAKRFIKIGFVVYEVTAPCLKRCTKG